MRHWQERRPRGTGRKAKKRARQDPDANLKLEITRKLGEANLMYMTGKFSEAIEILKDVIRMNPMLPDAYSTMALVYEALEDPKKAFNFSLLAAHLTPKVHRLSLHCGTAIHRALPSHPSLRRFIALCRTHGAAHAGAGLR
jgi:tetratricopeptide (TPR) repeat protein